MIGWKPCHVTCGCLDEDACVKAPKNAWKEVPGAPEKPAGALECVDYPTLACRCEEQRQGIFTKWGTSCRALAEFGHHSFCARNDGTM